MGFRYRKRIKILPYVSLNLSARGASLSFGRRRAHYTVSSTGKRTASVGLPGTGMSYTKTSTASSRGAWLFWIVAALAAAAILGWIWWQSRQPPAAG